MRATVRRANQEVRDARFREADDDAAELFERVDDRGFGRVTFGRVSHGKNTQLIVHAISNQIATPTTICSMRCWTRITSSGSGA